MVNCPFSQLRLAFAWATVALLSMSVSADVAYGTSVNKTSAGGVWGWGGTSTWTNSAGTVVQDPNGAGWSVVLADNTTCFSFATFKKNTSYILDSMSGGALQQVSFYNESSSSAYPAQRLTVGDASDFKGWVGNYDGNGLGELVLPSAAGATNAVFGVKLGAHFGVNVPEAGMTARVGAVSGDGALYCTGSGRLILADSPGCRGTLIATNGIVEIVGRDSAEAYVPGIIPGAALHLDASKEGTVDFGAVGADGYRHVTEWRDADGGPIVLVPDAYTQSDSATKIPWCNTPYLSEAAVSPSGLRMVDFGGIVGGSVPSNCCLKLSANIEKVCEVFIVGRNRGAGGYANYIGSVSGSHYEWSGGQANALFGSDASSNVRNGEIRINGQKATWCNVWPTRDGTSLSSVFVASAAVADGSDGEGPMSAVGTDRYARYRTGSMWLGELLVYTNKLTSAQRAKVNDYLMRKWLYNHGESVDFLGAYLGAPASAAAISVPAGRVAKIGEITVADGQKLVKKGGGTLIVGKLLPTGCAVQIEGGAVKIEEQLEMSASLPAADPYVWLDASDATTVVTNHVASQNSQINPNKYYVTRWNDCRAGAGRGIYAEVPSDWSGMAWFTTNYPYVTPAACNGRSTIYFGNNNASASWMWLNEHGSAYAYDGFVVVKINTTWNAGRSPQYFGSSITDIYREPDSSKTTTSRLLVANSCPAATEALWYLDGMLLDSRVETALLTDTAAYHVISFSSTSPLCADLLAKQGLAAARGGRDGDISIGEFITYDRMLTSDERRATTAYLMDKWLGKGLPATGEPTETFSDDVPAVIDTETDLTVASVSGGNGSFVKRGSGRVDLSSPTNLMGYSSITVEGGALHADLEAPSRARLEAALGRAVFDFDASSADSFSNEVATVGGVTRTNVIAWADAAGRKFPNQGAEPVIAYSSQIASNESLCVAIGDAASTRWKPGAEHPTLQYVEMPDGEKRPTVDFGDFGSGSTYAGAGMCFRRQFESNTREIAEIHTIFSDSHGSRRGTIVGARKTGSGKGYSFHRDQSGDGYLLASDARTEAKEGYVAIDAEVVQDPTSTALPAGFHLVSFVPTATLWVGNLGQDRQTSCGGCRISEQIAFTTALSTDDRVLLQKHLMQKWLGTPKDVAASYDRVCVATGATASFGSGTVIESATLSGGGTIEAGEVRGISTLEVSGEPGKITLSGTASFANDAVSVVLVDSPLALAVGEYTVFEADAIANDRLSVTLVGSFRPLRSVSVRKSGERIVLSVVEIGTMIIFR